MSVSQCTELAVAEVVEEIGRLVRDRTGGMVQQLRVDLVEEEVILSGRAPSFYTKQLATHAALEFIGDRTLVNDIEVS